MITPEHAAAAARDGIAVTGRLPRAANSDAFWELLVTGASAITETPPARWDANALYDADHGEPIGRGRTWRTSPRATAG